MPRKIRQLLKDYRKAGATIWTGKGKGSHRKITHAKVKGTVTLPGQEGDDAKPYMEKDLKSFLEEIDDNNEN